MSQSHRLPRPFCRDVVLSPRISSRIIYPNYPWALFLAHTPCTCVTQPVFKLDRGENSSLYDTPRMDQFRIFYTSKEAAHCLYDP